MGIVVKLPKYKEKNTDTVVKNRKELYFTTEYTVFVPCDENVIRRIVRCCIYKTNAKVHCCVWINDALQEIHLAGGGYAGGGGYHRPSAATESALTACGVQLSQSICGAGERAMREALGAVAIAMGYDKFFIHVAEG